VRRGVRWALRWEHARTRAHARPPRCPLTHRAAPAPLSRAPPPPHTRSHARAVIHAGIYYPPGSLKASLCVSGREALYAYCEERGVPHARVGKLLVAARPEQEDALRALAARGAANGVRDLRWLSGAQAAALEPRLRASAALLSPSSGIVDSAALMAALQADAEGARALSGCARCVRVVLAWPPAADNAECRACARAAQTPARWWRCAPRWWAERCCLAAAASDWTSLTQALPRHRHHHRRRRLAALLLLPPP
jgi:hypothetical protein